jgi:hypothetical protein
VTIVAAQNHAKDGYNVNDTDVALENRFRGYNVRFDQNEFVEIMKKDDFHPTVVSFVDSGQWVYNDVEQLGEGQKYLSGRNFRTLSYLMKNMDIDDEMFPIHVDANLGRDVGTMFIKFCHDNKAVTVNDLLRNRKKALNDLRRVCGENYRGDTLAITLQSVMDGFNGCFEDDDKKIGWKTIEELSYILPHDQIVMLATELLIEPAKKDSGFSDLKASIETRKKVLTDNIPDSNFIKIAREFGRATSYTGEGHGTDKKAVNS